MKNVFYLLSLSAAVLCMSACSKPQTERLICAEAEMASFPYSENGLRVVKHQTVTPVEGVDGLEVVETYFVNEGKPVTVKAYELCRTEIEAKDSVVWSLQPSSSNARMDWVLPVQEGFAKQNYLGMNNSDYGGGIPVVDLWQRDGGMAIGLFEPVLRMISMPVEWKLATRPWTYNPASGMWENARVQFGSSMDSGTGSYTAIEGDNWAACNLSSKSISIQSAAGSAAGTCYFYVGTITDGKQTGGSYYTPMIFMWE